MLTADTCCAKCTGTNISFNICAVKNLTEARSAELHTGADGFKTGKFASDVKAGPLVRMNDACNRFQEMEKKPKTLPFRLRDDTEVCRFYFFNFVC